MSFPVRIACVFGLSAVLLGVNLAQTPARRPTSGQNPEVAVWRVSKMTALQLAQKTDQHLAALKKTECETETVVAMPKRMGRGQMQVVSRIQDRLMYEIVYPGISFKKQDELRKIRVKADGQTSEFREPHLAKKISRPAGKMTLVNQATPIDWVMGHPGYVFGSVLGENAFTSLVRAASKPGSGYQIKVSERVIRRLNKPYPQYRLTVLRTPAAAKKSGAVQVDAIIDGSLWLPVTMFGAADFKEKGKEPIRVANNLQWRVSKTPFDPKSFKFKKA